MFIMHRKTLKFLFCTAVQKISLNPTIGRLPSCSHIHLSRPLLYSEAKPEQDIRQSKEPITDFSAHDADLFGTLNSRNDINAILEKMPEEEDDKIEFIIHDETGRKVRRSISYYVKLIKKFVSERKIADAIDVLEERMLKRDKVKPNYYIYNLLINGCAHAGYTLKAFKLYNQMKKTDVKQTNATYTGLFNACANSPFPEDALMRVNNLRRELVEKSIELNVINYNALIKAYGRLKDTKAAFLVMDEMISKRYTLNEDNFVFLFQACASDKEAGFRHALVLWHKMKGRNVIPNKFIYNQFLRCVRDCGIGDVHETIDTIKRISDDRGAWRKFTTNQLGTNTENAVLSIASSEDHFAKLEIIETQKSSNSHDLSILEKVENRPNLLDPNPHLGSIVELRDVNTSTDRLLLLGGFRNILHEMELDGVKPDIKTFTLLLDMIPSTLTAEEALIKELHKHEIPIDIDFCNMLIKKRAYRQDYENGRATLNLIQSFYLNPDIVTFGVLALCCRNTADAKELLRDMKQFGYQLNVEIIGGMLKNACANFNYLYAVFLMKLIKRMDIQPSEIFMDNLKKLLEKSKKFFNQKKNCTPKSTLAEKNPQHFENYKIFKDYYQEWKKEVTVYVPPHPYKQFQQRFEPKEDEEEEFVEVEEITEKQKISSKKQEVQYPGSPDKWSQTKPKPKLLDSRFNRSANRRQLTAPKQLFSKNDASDSKNDTGKLSWKRKVVENSVYDDNLTSEVGSKTENSTFKFENNRKLSWTRKKSGN